MPEYRKLFLALLTGFGMGCAVINAIGGKPLAVIRPTNLGALPMQASLATKSMHFLARPGMKSMRNVASAAEYSPDQLAFLARKKAASGISSAPVASGSSGSSSSGQEYSPDQLAFLKRREMETGKKWQPPKMDGPEPRSWESIDRVASETYMSGSSSGGGGAQGGYMPSYLPKYMPSFHK